MTCGSDKKIAAWEVFDGSLIRELEASAAGSVNGLDISPDGRTIVSAGEDKILKVWKYNEGEVTHAGAGHSGAVTDVKISPDQKFILAVCDDGSIFRWAFP